MNPPITSPEVIRVVAAFFLSVVLGARGRRKGSLSDSGAVAAFLVGFLTWASTVRFGVTLITFYLSATKATRFRASEKEKYEDDTGGPGGNRNAAQVLASSGPAVICSVWHFWLFRFDAPVRASSPVSASLNLAYLLFIAACCGDTYASEFGAALPRSGHCPVLITNPFVSVPRGTNGGITWQGTLASGVGGLVIGLAFYIAGPSHSLDQVVLVPLGVFGGVLGSVLDSLIGALFQITLLDPDTGKVLKSVPKPGSAIAKRARRICGRDVLNGELVNFIAACGTAALAPILVLWLF